MKEYICIYDEDEMQFIRNPFTYKDELIRCKDCKYAVDEYHDGECYCGKTNLSYIGADWEHYCSWAERGENETRR